MAEVKATNGLAWPAALVGLGIPIACHTVSGGCISVAYQVLIRRETGETQKLFVKQNQLDFYDNFDCECAGLKQLADVGAIRVPQPVCVACTAEAAWLITEWIDSPSPKQRAAADSSKFYETFGQQLAALHAQTHGTAIGWHRDNYLGAARQCNDSTGDDWAAFVGQQRLGYQLDWAGRQGLVSGQLHRDASQIVLRLPELLRGRPSGSSLLHGDLWSGNYLVDAAGQPVLVDPAIYRGCREAEFGMLRLFGNCPAAFYAAYHERFPLAEGWQRRVAIYQLYHLLNHLNLFGSGYLDACQRTARGILAA